MTYRMTLPVFLLVLISALCHAAWNFAVRSAAGNLVAVWLGLWLGSALILPGVIGVSVLNEAPQAVTVQSILCIVATGLIHGVYFLLLASAYEVGEISLVYPMARGSGIAVTAILAGVFFKEDVSLLGGIGIGFISAGIVSLSAVTKRKANDAKAIRLALLTGVTIVAYSLVDKMGVRYVHPVVYIWFMFLISAVSLTPFVMRRYAGALGQESRQALAYAMVIGVGSMATYLMILFAFTIAPVGYTVAVREFAVVVGALAGVILLKERLTIPKAIAICAIVTGITCIKLG